VHSALPQLSRRCSILSAVFVVTTAPVLVLVVILGLAAWFFQFMGNWGADPPRPPPPQHAK
jgi:hypothetical protein